MKAYYNKSQIENIVGLLLKISKHMTQVDSEELVNEVKEYLLSNDRPLEIMLEVLIKIKSHDTNNKVTNPATIENAEIVRRMSVNGSS